jgi:hypothetical protein
MPQPGMTVVPGTLTADDTVVASGRVEYSTANRFTMSVETLERRDGPDAVRTDGTRRCAASRCCISDCAQQLLL